MRHDLPETAVWLVRQGRFRQAKQVAMDMYNDRLDMLPDEDAVVPKPRPTAFLADLRKDPIRWRATCTAGSPASARPPSSRPSASISLCCSSWWACRRSWALI
jgi:hypothetical protein